MSESAAVEVGSLTARVLTAASVPHVGRRTADCLTQRAL